MEADKIFNRKWWNTRGVYWINWKDRYLSRVYSVKGVLCFGKVDLKTNEVTVFVSIPPGLKKFLKDIFDCLENGNLSERLINKVQEKNGRKNSHFFHKFPKLKDEKGQYLEFKSNSYGGFSKAISSGDGLLSGPLMKNITNCTIVNPPQEFLVYSKFHPYERWIKEKKFDQNRHREICNYYFFWGNSTYKIEDFRSASSPGELRICHPAVFQGILEMKCIQDQKVVGTEWKDEVFRWRNWFHNRSLGQIHHDQTFDSNHQSFLNLLWSQGYPRRNTTSQKSQDSENLESYSLF
eukprot:GHVP01048848.1.p1 GENE.GHVP01048848.1~~GHVP01048848.1.p1  ORF type:complete len:317 (+),score=40.79 GHVP01048848.1:75-953(+)